MNERQNMVIATMISGLILVVVYLSPWCIESTEEVKWSPIYQPPMSYVRSYDNERRSQGSSRIETEEAHIAVGLLVLEVLALGVAGGALYFYYASSEDQEEVPSDSLR
jgi:hypothetical protein